MKSQQPAPQPDCVCFQNRLFGLEGDGVRNARLFAEGRIHEPAKRGRAGTEMNRLYAVAPHLTSTSVAADHRLRLPGSLVGAFLAALTAELRKRGLAHGLEAPAVTPATFAKAAAAWAMACSLWAR